jgi:hypothetical protein
MFGFRLQGALAPALSAATRARSPTRASGEGDGTAARLLDPLRGLSEPPPSAGVRNVVERGSSMELLSEDGPFRILSHKDVRRLKGGGWLYYGVLAFVLVAVFIWR